MGNGLYEITMPILKWWFATFALKSWQYSGHLSVPAPGILLLPSTSPSAYPICSSSHWFNWEFHTFSTRLAKMIFLGSMLGFT